MANISFCNIARRYSFDEELKIPSSMKEVARVRDYLNELLSVAGWSTKEKMNICLSLDEAMTNAVEHGNLKGQKFVDVGVAIGQDVCILQIVDYGGCLFNPEYFEKLSEIKDWGLGGRGIFLIKNLMDEVYYFFSPSESTTVVMIKYRSGVGPQDAIYLSKTKLEASDASSSSQATLYLPGEKGSQKPEH